MKNRRSLILFLFLITGTLILACWYNSKDKEDEALPCMCFINNSSYAVRGFQYRITGTSTWTTKYFDETQYSGDGFNCAEGAFDSAIPVGNYDFQLIKSGGEFYIKWTNVPYNGGNVGFAATNYTSSSKYAAVNGNCASVGTEYSATSMY